MKEILASVPVYERKETEVPANLYNLVAIALKRLKAPIRFELPRLRTLELLLDRDAWIVVDTRLNDIPVLAWLDFATQGRTSLHEPVPCYLNLYHVHGQMLLPRIIEAMEIILGEQLAGDDDDDKVLGFHSDG